MKISQKNTRYLDSNKKAVFCLKDIFNLLSNINRFRIFCAPVKHDKLTNQDIYNILKISRLLGGKHLRILELNRILLREKQGFLVYYSLNLSNRGVKTAKTAFVSFYKDSL